MGWEAYAELGWSNLAGLQSTCYRHHGPVPAAALALAHRTVF